MARPTPCIGCGLELDEDGALQAKLADPLTCTEDGIGVKLDDSLELTEAGELSVVTAVYPVLHDSHDWGGEHMTGAFLEASTTGSTIHLTTVETLTIANTTDRTYMALGSWDATAFIARTGSTAASDYTVFLHSTVGVNAVAIGSTGQNDGLRSSHYGSSGAAQSIHASIAGGTGFITLNPGDTLTWEAAMSYRVDVLGDGVDDIGFHYARFRLIGHPL